MKGRVHVAIGLATAAAIGHHSVPIYGAVIIGSLLPDIDLESSQIGKLAGPLNPFKKLKHRGFTHSLVFAGLITLLILYIGTTEASWYFILGIIMHDIADMLNHPGVQFLWPLKIRIRVWPSFLRFSIDSIREKILYLGCIIFFAYKIIPVIFFKGL